MGPEILPCAMAWPLLLSLFSLENKRGVVVYYNNFQIERREKARYSEVPLGQGYTFKVISFLTLTLH